MSANDENLASKVVVSSLETTKTKRLNGLFLKKYLTFHNISFSHQKCYDYIMISK